MTDKRKRGRPASAHNVKITPDFREVPDIEKIGRALIAIAINNAKEKESDKETASLSETALAKYLPVENKGDLMT